MYTIDDLLSSDNQWIAARKTLKQKHILKRDPSIFKSELLLNMDLIKEDIINKRYKHGGYNRFIVNEGKKRLIDAPSTRDKYVHHLINNLYLPYFKSLFIEDSYACIPGRGNYYAVLKLQSYLNRALMEKEVWVVSIDISKFFNSIDLNILYYTILPKYIKDPDILYLLKIIIFSYTKGGLPLGNLTSQLLANIYLNELDWFIKRTLRVRFYVRYADDLSIFVNSKEEAEYIFNSIKNFVKNKLNMDIHPRKSNVIRFTEEYKSLGFLYTRKGIRISSEKYRSVQKRFINDDKKGKLSNGTRSAYAHITIAINFKNTDSLRHMIGKSRLLIIKRGTVYKGKLINNLKSITTHQVLARDKDNIYLWIENRTNRRCEYIEQLDKGEYWFNYNYFHLVILLGGHNLAKAWVLSNRKHAVKIEYLPEDIREYLS